MSIESNRNEILRERNRIEKERNRLMAKRDEQFIKLLKALFKELGKR